MILEYFARGGKHLAGMAGLEWQTASKFASDSRFFALRQGMRETRRSLLSAARSFLLPHSDELSFFSEQATYLKFKLKFVIDLSSLSSE